MIYTDNYNLKKPEYGDTADIKDINDNTDDIDTLIHQNRTMIAPAFVTTKAYTTGDPVEYLGASYIFIADKSAGPWDASKVEPKTAAEMGGSGTGGASALVDLDDVSIDTPTEGQALIYNETDEVWENQTLPDPSVTKEASGNPIELTDAASAPLVKCVTQITGSQDLHGYDKPWVGGAGKNKLALTVADFKANNISGTWSGNVYTYLGCKYTLNTDDGGNVISIGVEYSSQSTDVTLPFSLKAGSYVLTSGFSEDNGVNDSYLQKNGVTIARGNGASPGNQFTLSEDSTVVWHLRVTNKNYTAYPMIRLATESDPTFAPYSNICPITAYTEGEIEVRGKNILNPNSAISYGSGSSTYSVSGNAINVTTSGQYSGIVFDKELPNGTYSISFSFKFNNSGTASVAIMDEDNTTSLWTTGEFSSDTTRSGNFTVTHGIAHIRFYCTRSNASGNVTISNLMLNTGSSATDYEPYVATTHTTTFPSAIYRGSEDLVNGEVMSEMHVIDLGDFDYTYQSANDRFVSTTQVQNMKYSANDNTPFNGVCSHFEVVSPALTTGGSGITYGIANGTSDSLLRIKYQGVTDPTIFKSLVTGVKLAYELATPTTSSVTPTNLPIKSLSGYNHLESSTGDMEVEYITGEYQPLVDLIQSSKHVYSTQEQIVGTWVDGKDIFEKTFELQSEVTLTINQWNSITGVSLSGVETPIGAEIRGSRGISVANVDFIDSPVSVWGTSGTEKIKSITFRYTKTTQTRSLNTSLNTQKAQIEPLTDKTEDLSSEDEKSLKTDESVVKTNDTEPEVEEIIEEEKDVEDSSENQER